MIGLGNSVVKRKIIAPSVPAAPVNVVLPSLTGTGVAGSVITCNKGVWTGVPTPTYEYDFKADGISVQFGLSNEYVTSGPDIDKVITCEVTATNSQGSANATTSNSITVGTAPVNTVAPTVSPSGTQITGTVITASVGTWTGTPTITYEYRWTRNGSPISGAVNNTYTIQATDDGTTIRCEVRGTNAYGVSSFVASSNSVSAVNAIAPVNTVAPVISGTAVVGQTLSSTTGTWTGTPTPTYSYQWFRGATPIGTNSANYTLVQADAGNTSNITCRVTATNSAGSANATSNTIAQIFDATWWDFRQTLSITDTTINNAMNTYTITRKSISATASLGAYPMVGGTATTHSRNLYNSADTDAAKRVTWAGTITHNSNGVQGNGINGIGNTFINTSTEFSSNDFTIIWYSRTNQARNECDFGVTDGSAGGLNMASKWGDNNTFTAGLSTNVNSGNVVSNSSGCFVFKRSGNTITLSRNGVNIITRTDSGNIKINQTIRIIGRWRSGLNDEVFSSKQYTHFEIMNFALNSTQETNIINAVIAKETALSRNV